jgi:prepilin-type N-terminal cleavage/methylation domain-containing protein
MMPKNSKKTAGFTMIEMAIVAVLVGVLATLAVPMFTRTLPRLKCHAEARNLLSAVRVARSRAIAENIQYGVYFDTNARTYIIFKDIVNQTQYRYNGGDSIVMGPVALDANVVYTGITFSGNSIVMFPTGAASETGTVGINTCSGDTPYTISVLAATGKTRLQ